MIDSVKIGLRSHRALPGSNDLLSFRFLIYFLKLKVSFVKLLNILHKKTNINVRLFPE